MNTRFTLLLLALPVALHAQSMHDDRFDWGPIEVVVYADTISGVGVLAGTTEFSDASQFRGFGASFDPAVVPSWVTAATAFVDAKDPGGAEDLSAAPPLVNAGSDSLLLFRRRRDGRWESGVIVQMVSGRGGKGMTLLATKEQARGFLRSLGRHGPTSRYQAELMRRASELSDAHVPYDVPPKVRFKGEDRHFGRRGVAVLRFRVTVEGRVDPESFEVVRTDNPLFAAAARASLVTSLWEPALAQGSRVEAGVVLTIQFE